MSENLSFLQKYLDARGESSTFAEYNRNFAIAILNNKKTMIRQAQKQDIHQILELLHQVNMVHHELRPDLFKPHTTKYDAQELEALLQDPKSLIFVFDSEGRILGHAFCLIQEVKSHRLLEDIRTLYIDDICVDESARGQHVGKHLCR